MNIYFVDRDLRSLMENAFDPETGELVMDEEAFRKEYAYLSSKIENILEETALMVKEDAQMMDGIDAEIKKLEKRKAAYSKRKARNERLVMEYSNCQNFETPRVAVKFRLSARVNIKNEEEFVKWAIENCNFDLVNHKEVITDTPNKVAIKKWLKSGATSEFAEIVSNMNMSTT